MMEDEEEELRRVVREQAKKLLAEDPHQITKDGRTMSMHFTDPNKVPAHGFGFDNSGNAYIGFDPGDHGAFEIDQGGKTGKSGYEDPPGSRGEFKYPGRIFLDPKVISFWTYPSRHELFPLLKKLEREWQDRFPEKKAIDFSSGWEVEIWDDNTGESKEFIPVSDYEKPDEKGKGRTHSANLAAHNRASSDERKLREVIRTMVKKLI